MDDEQAGDFADALWLRKKAELQSSVEDLRISVK